MSGWARAILVLVLCVVGYFTPGTEGDLIRTAALALAAYNLGRTHGAKEQRPASPVGGEQQ